MHISTILTMSLTLPKIPSSKLASNRYIAWQTEVEWYSTYIRHTQGTKYVDSALEGKYNVRTLQSWANSPPISDDVDHSLGQAQESGQPAGDQQDVEEE